MSVYTQGAQLVSGSVSISSANVFTDGPQAVSGTVSITVTGSTGLHVANNVTTPLWITVSSSLPISGNFGETDNFNRKIIVGCCVTGSTVNSNPVIIGGIDTSDLIVTGDIVRGINVDALGRVITVSPGSVFATPSIAYGTIATAATTTVAVRGTTYTEPNANAQRSVTSSSGNDNASGSGARAMQIIYYDSSTNGPFTESITLNGTSPVNTVNTNICFIEKMIVTSVGSGGQNAGILALQSGTAGGGPSIGSIAVGLNTTAWAHHYVPPGKKCYVTSILAQNQGSSTAAVFFIRNKLTGSTAPDIMLYDTVRGAAASQGIVRVYTSPLVFEARSRITLFVTPEAATAATQRASFEFYDQ